MILTAIAIILILAFLPQLIELAAALVLVAIYLIKWGLIIGLPLFVVFVIIMVNLPG